MARTSDQVSQKEIQAYTEFCQKHHIVNDDTEAEVSQKNAALIGEIVVNIWKEDLTPATLAAALDKLRDRIVFKSPVQVNYERVVTKMSATEFDTLRNWFQKQRLERYGDNGMLNVVALGEWIQEHNMDFSSRSLDLALSNIVNSGKRPLHWKPAPLQDSEKERQRQREASSTPPRQERSETVVSPELTLAPHLRAHQEMLHRPSETVKVSRQDSNAEWRVRAESVTTNSHLDRAQLSKLFVMQQSNPTEIDWQATTRAREIYVERRKHARVNSGR